MGDPCPPLSHPPHQPPVPRSWCSWTELGREAHGGFETLQDPFSWRPTPTSSWVCLWAPGVCDQAHASLLLGGLLATSTWTDVAQHNRQHARGPSFAGSTGLSPPRVLCPKGRDLCLVGRQRPAWMVRCSQTPQAGPVSTGPLRGGTLPAAGNATACPLVCLDGRAVTGQAVPHPLSQERDHL